MTSTEIQCTRARKISATASGYRGRSLIVPQQSTDNMLPVLRPHQQQDLNFRWLPKKMPIAEKLECYIMRITDSGCWIWLGALNHKGYGKINGKIAHRVSYEIHIGPIPDGLQLDHGCRVRCCVNPRHLEPVTLIENIARGEVGQYNARKTHCSEGHEFTPENTGRYHNERYCRKCRSNWKKAARLRAKIT